MTEAAVPGAAGPRDLEASIIEKMAEWGAGWGLPGLETRVQVRFSGRLTASLGRCTPATGSIRLHAGLATGPPEFLAEVLCHELAHVAAHELHGDGIRPHGHEWQALVSAAGYRPSTRLRPPDGVMSPVRRRRRRRRRFTYLHRCPSCGWERTARAVVRRWRCPTCPARGGDGRLEVWRYGSP